MTLLTRRRALAGAAATLAAPALVARAALGADWRPTEQVRIIVPAAPGGTTDLMGRLLGQHLQVAWGQSTVVENKSGGGGTIAMSDFARQKPDGHTVMICNPGPNAVAYSIFRNMTYKPEQLQPVTQPDPYAEHRLGASVRAGEVHQGTDRLHQSKPREALLRDLRRRAEPAPHSRLVPATDRPDDAARAVPRRGPRAHRRARRTGAGVVRQSLSFSAAGQGRQAARARGHHEGAQLPGARAPDDGRERAASLPSSRWRRGSA